MRGSRGTPARKREPDKAPQKPDIKPSRDRIPKDKDLAEKKAPPVQL